MTRQSVATIGITLVLLGVASAQGQRPPSTPDDLLAEVRALRADLNQFSSASIRAQLLVGRLQLQEGRMNVVARQLADVQAQVGAAVRQVEEAVSSIKDADDAVNRADHNTRKELEIQRGHYTSDLPRRQQREQQLRAHETELATLLATEQSRWSDLNSRLDELERTLTNVAR